MITVEAVIRINLLAIKPVDFVEQWGFAEWYVGTRGGCSDHAAIICGRNNTILHITAFPLSVEEATLPAGYSFVLADSDIKAKKQAGARDIFNSRVAGYIFGLMLIRNNFPEFADKLERFRDINPKILGVDDYIVKPFDEADLLASIAGKITRHKKIHSINKKVSELFNSLDIEITPLVEKKKPVYIVLVYIGWDDLRGPFLQDFHPQDIELPLPLETIGFQLFAGATSIYGQNKIYQGQGFLLNIENIQSQGYVFFHLKRFFGPYTLSRVHSVALRPCSSNHRAFHQKFL